MVGEYIRRSDALDAVAALWLCDRCYKKMVVVMALPPYDEEIDYETN